MPLVSFRPFRLAPLLAAAGALLAAGCGGDVYQRFEPQRILSLGDEYSYIGTGPDDDPGARYTVDALNSDGSRNCAHDRYWLWNQRVAARYGRAFAECPVPGYVSDGSTRALARERTTVNMLASQLDAVGGVKDKDLLLVFVGANDVWDIYGDPSAQVPPPDLKGYCAGEGEGDNKGPTVPEQQAACARGQALAEQLLAWTKVGARVVVLDLPYQGTTPQAASEDRARLNSLTEAFNKGLRFNLPDNSRYIALVQANNRVELAQKTENSPYPFRNRTEAVCTTVSAKDCTTATVKIADASSNGYEYVFAAERYLSPTMNRLIGDLAADRARNQPF
ncbi:MAG: hypothetical protein AB1666_06895 [Pseudomonadota bacterium]